jgi:hypothetical protein
LIFMHIMTIHCVGWTYTIDNCFTNIAFHPDDNALHPGIVLALQHVHKALDFEHMDPLIFKRAAVSNPQLLNGLGYLMGRFPYHSHSHQDAVLAAHLCRILFNSEEHADEQLQEELKIAASQSAPLIEHLGRLAFDSGERRDPTAMSEVCCALSHLVFPASKSVYKHMQEVTDELMLSSPKNKVDIALMESGSVVAQAVRMLERHAEPEWREKDIELWEQEVCSYGSSIEMWLTHRQTAFPLISYLTARWDSPVGSGSSETNRAMQALSKALKQTQSPPNEPTGTTAPIVRALLLLANEREEG